MFEHAEEGGEEQQAHPNGRIRVAGGLGHQDQFHALYSQISACQRAIHELGDQHNQTDEKIMHDIQTMNGSIQRVAMPSSLLFDQHNSSKFGMQMNNHHNQPEKTFTIDVTMQFLLLISDHFMYSGKSMNLE